jgi:hypothetical protein
MDTTNDIEITTSNKELRTTREAMRELNSIIEQLASGSVEKIVLTRNGQIVGVLLSPDMYADLVGE